MSNSGYYRFPSIYEDTIAFASEDDLWTVSREGGVARRLTTGLGSSAYPRFSPGGEWIAFSGRDEGPREVYAIPAIGGQPQRLTYLGVTAIVVGWTPGGKVVFASEYDKPFSRMVHLFTVSLEDRSVEELPYGPALTVSFGPEGGAVIGRYGMVTREPAYWKRYRGGTAGDIWIDPSGAGEFRRLLTISGNVTHPLWLGDRIYFASDHEGIGNLYSCDLSGADVRRHTDHSDYYVRHPASDGRQIIYHAGADLYRFDPTADRKAQVPVVYASPRNGRHRKFVDPARYLEGYALHPRGHMLTLTTRGKPFVLGNWEGAAVQLGEPDGVRYRCARWLADGERIAVISDAAGEESLEIHASDGLEKARRLGEREVGTDIGTPRNLQAAPVGSRLALVNHRSELVLVDLEDGAARVLDRSPFNEIMGFDWSPDGRWLAYDCWIGENKSIIRLYDVERGEIHDVTRAAVMDVCPVFDREGRYLFFLGVREVKPVMDELRFDLCFPRAVRPYVVTLKRDEPSLFLPEPKPLGGDKRNTTSAGGSADSGGSAGAGRSPDPDGSAGSGGAADRSGVPNSGTPSSSQGEPPAPVEIDFEGIADRIEAFPVPERRYRGIYPLPGKLMISHLPVRSMLDEPGIFAAEPDSSAILELFDFETHKTETLVNGFADLTLSADGSTMAYRVGRKLRVVKAGEKPDEKTATDEPGRKSGWVDLRRLRVSVNPPSEWRQMYRHAWRLQRDHFWTPDMAQVDWREVYERYHPLLGRVGTRSEFSDLMWEMQGELGTSHAYELGGDYPKPPNYRIGGLGAELVWDGTSDLWKIERIYRGDPAIAEESSPLLRPGVNAREGETLIAIDGCRPSEQVTPAELLVNKAGTVVALTLADEEGRKPRTVQLRTLKDQEPLWYREWVEQNRRLVHERTEGRAGYIHIPDMSGRGFAEFHRLFLQEVDRQGLVVDVRFNRGGMVSALLLEKLARRRLAYVKTRWFGAMPWPTHAPPGPTAILTNEWAASDGDIFSHSAKLLGLGPLIGKRTWGGVIGISPRDLLVDRGITTQPEFSFWFLDVGWGVENYGTEPDIEVEVAPQDYAAKRDPQLDRGIAEVERLIQERPAPQPDFAPPPSRSVPRLPKTDGA